MQQVSGAAAWAHAATKHTGEELAWWDLVARAQLCRLVLFAYYDIPASLDIPLKLHSNPVGFRAEPRVWNDGSNRRKFICFEPKASGLLKSPGDEAAAVAAESAPPEHASVVLQSMGEVDEGDESERESSDDGLMNEHLALR
jgi:hypothetical protein